MSGQGESGSVVENVAKNPQKNKKESYARFARLEVVVGDHHDTLRGLGDNMDEAMKRLTALEKGKEEMEARLQEVENGGKDLRGEVQGLINTILGSLREELGHLVKENIERLAEIVEGRFQALEGRMEEVKADVLFCRAAVAGSAIIRGAPNTRIPEQPKFSGRRDAREIDTFFWSVERYLNAMGITDDASKINTATMYLVDDACLWWRRREAEMNKGLCQISTWEEFKADFKKQFYPENAREVALRKLRALKHTGTIKDYIKQYSSLLLDIDNLPEDVSLLYFMDGLQRWAEQELRRRNVKSLSEAIAVAESLYELPSDSMKDKFDKRGGEEFGGGEDHQPRGKNKEESKMSKDTWKSKETTFSDGKLKNRDCFLCGGPHLVRECPQRQKLNALALKMDEEESEAKMGALRMVDGEPSRLGAMRLLNSTRVMENKPRVEATTTNEGTSSKYKGHLLTVNGEVNDVRTRVLIDSGATHNYVALRVAKDLGIRYTKSGGELKAVNSSSTPIYGVAYQVPIRLGKWKGRTKFMVVDMDDEDVVLGMEFINSVRPFKLGDRVITITTQGGEVDIKLAREEEDNARIASLRVIKVPRSRHKPRVRGRTNSEGHQGQTQDMSRATSESGHQGTTVTRTSTVLVGENVTGRLLSYRGSRAGRETVSERHNFVGNSRRRKKHLARSGII
ncbi:hypothetical protein RND81_05G120500 [Saponaria officinalis]|uniref:Ty3 transposon capsid-like protein domain-containing protein n=1 Tax=Saponaria officinalis TaxID=3572 RepID=A0AAW1KX65_SAPOF